MVEQVLANPLVASLVCGPEHLLIYNDAAAALYGKRHPAALGQALPVTFPVGWATVEPFYQRAFAGDVVQVHGQPLDTRGEGDPQADVFDAVLTPVHEEDGGVAYVHMVGTEFRRRARAEAIERQNDQQLVAIFGSAAVGLSELAQDGRFLRVNDEICRILGRTREEVLQLSILDVTYPDDVPPSLAAVGEALRTNQRASLDKRYLRPDGSLVWANSRVQQLHHNLGRPSTLLAVTADLSDRRSAEERLRESEARFRGLVEGFSQAIWEASPEGLITTDSPEWRAHTGQSFDEWIGTGWLNAIHPEDQAETIRKWHEAVAAKRAVDHEYRLWHAESASWRWSNVRVVPIVDLDGMIRRWAGINIDVHDRRASEQRLRESEERFRALASLVPVILWRSDATGTVHSQNQSWLDYSGQTKQQADDSGWLEAVHPQDREPAREAFRIGIQNGCPIEVQHRMCRRDGQYRWFLVRQVPILDGQGRVTEWFGAAMDIHELRELQQRQAVMVDELQHRTRNLLTVVRAIAQQTMTQTGPTEQFREQFNDRIAALSRVQGLLSRSDQEPIVIRALVLIELDALGVTARCERVALEGPRVVLRKASVQTLALALHELATNSRKYGALANEQGELWISWDTYTVEAGEQRLSLTWLEEGIRTPEGDNPIRRGYGRELIEKALPYALKARTSYEISGAELRCSIDLPLTDGTKVGR